MYLIWQGKFYNDGRPYRVAKTEKEAIEYLKRNGYCKSRGQDLYEIEIEKDLYWARIDSIEEV